jgi:hypothetical protein
MSQNALLKVLTAVAVIAALISFGSAIYLVNDNASLKQQLADSSGAQHGIQLEQPAIPRPVVKTTEENSEELAALNAYIDRLEAENQNLKQQLANSQQARPGRQNRQRGPRMDMEQMKESDPERYERIMSFRENMQKAMQERAQRRNDYFASLDTSKLSAEQRSTLSDYQTLLGEVETTMTNGGDFRDMREAGMELWRMRGDVQNILVENLGAQLGADGETLKQGLQQISEITGGFGNPFQGLPQMGGFGGGPGGPGGRGGRGGR